MAIHLSLMEITVQETSLPEAFAPELPGHFALSHLEVLVQQQAMRLLALLRLMFRKLPGHSVNDELPSKLRHELNYFFIQCSKNLYRSLSIIDNCQEDASHFFRRILSVAYKR